MGYWAGLTWADSSPAKGRFDFSALDTTIKQADAADQFCEINALVGQCAPKWLYTAGIEPLIVNWKPPTSCVPPTCYPCNQTFPDCAIFH